MGPDGIKVRDHLLAVSGMGIYVPELDMPIFPEPARHLWRAFVSLQQTRGANYGIPHPITYVEILAYATLMGDHLEPWEVALVKTLDLIFLENGVDHGSRHSNSDGGS